MEVQSLQLDQTLRARHSVVHEGLLIGLIASLPLFAVRGWAGGLSLPLLFLLFGLGLVLVQGIASLRLPNVLTKFDLLLGSYFLVALIGLLTSTYDDVFFAILKSSVYFASYLALKMLLVSIPSTVVARSMVRGIALGTVGFGLASLYALWATGSISVLFGPFSYWTFTLNVFSAIDQVFGGGREDFASVNVMRNAVGEAFAFYVIAALTFNWRGRMGQVAVVLANIMFALSMFSRRAFLALMFIVLGVAIQLRGGLRLLAVSLLGLVAATYFSGSWSLGRLVDFSDQARADQYAEAIQAIVEKPLFGHGYGARLSTDNYVHNFVLAGTMMMGVLGLLVTILIAFYIFKSCMAGLKAKGGIQLPVLLIIPLLGMLVGSTVEGIFTITSWVAIALHEVECNTRKVE